VRGRSRWLVRPLDGRRRLLTEQHHGGDRRRHAECRQRRKLLAEHQPGNERHDHGTDGGHRCHDAHRPHRQAAIQQRDADAAGEPGQRAEADVGGRDRGPEHQRRGEHEQEQSGALRGHDGGQRRRPLGHRAAEEVSGAVDRGGRQGQERDHIEA
jgi:hypothetical protein